MTFKDLSTSQILHHIPHQIFLLYKILNSLKPNEFAVKVKNCREESTRLRFNNPPQITRITLLQPFYAISWRLCFAECLFSPLKRKSLFNIFFVKRLKCVQ